MKLKIEIFCVSIFLQNRHELLGQPNIYIYIYKWYVLCTKHIDAQNENRAKRDRGVYAHVKRSEKIAGQNDE